LPAISPDKMPIGTSSLSIWLNAQSFAASAAAASGNPAPISGGATMKVCAPVTVTR